MIRRFGTPGAEDIFNGKNTKAARNASPRDSWAVAARKLDQLDSAEIVDNH
jgi:toxin HigB-1